MSDQEKIKTVPVTKEKVPYFIIQTQVVLTDDQVGHVTYLKGSPEEGVGDLIEDAGIIADRENGVARLGILAGYLGRKSARPLAEAIVGYSDTALTTVNLVLVQMDKNDHVHDPSVVRVVLYITKSPEDGDVSVQIASGPL